MENFEKLGDEILAKRWGVVHFDVRAFDRRQFEQINHLLDSYVEQLGMHGIGESWREVDASSARKIIQRILHRDLAYTARGLKLRFFRRKKAQTMPVGSIRFRANAPE